jgi:sugar/nucleoside kinase (ribokinase family)
VTRVLVVGDIVTDVLAVVAGAIVRDSDTPAEIRVAGGGAGANAAAWLAHAGTAVTLCGVVGGDEAAGTRLAELAAAGVNLAVRRAPGARTGSIVVLTDGRDRSMLTDRGANLLLSPSDIDTALTPDVAHLHLSGYALLDDESRPAARYALTAAAERQLTTSVDAASEGPLRRVGGSDFLSWVRGTDILFANLDEAHALLDAAPDLGPTDAAARLAATVRLAVVKLGAGGAVAAAGLDSVRVPSPPAEARDTTGAGDAFAAGFLSRWTRDRDIPAALAAGCAQGARAVTHVGARPPAR